LYVYVASFFKYTDDLTLEVWYRQKRISSVVMGVGRVGIVNE